LSPGARQALTEARDAKREAKGKELQAKPDKPEPKEAAPKAQSEGAAEAAPSAETKPELLSPKLAKLAHREKLLLEREKAAKDATSNHEKAIADARAAVIAEAKKKGLSFLMEDAGVSPDDVVKAYLGLPAPKTEPEKKLEAIESKVDAALKAYEEDQKKAKEAQVAQANEKYQEIQATIQREIGTAIEDPKFKEIKKRAAMFRSEKNKGSNGPVGFIYDIIVDAWETSQQVKTPEEVADFLISVYEQEEAKEAEALKTKPKDEDDEEVVAPKKTHRPLSASRAVAATAPNPSGPLTKDQRYERAMAVLRAGRSKQ
jgi:hypothetical protein